MLVALIGGLALPSGELARAAGVRPSTASAHLARLRNLGVVDVEHHGRHRYYRLASAHVAQLAEMLAQFAPSVPVRSLRGTQISSALATARTCYDHLAGALGVAILDAFVDKGVVTIDYGQVQLEHGADLLNQLDIDVAAFRRDRRRPEARLCLDWSARRHHFAGALGEGIMNRLLEWRWVKRAADTRAVSVTPEGWRGLGQHLDIHSPEDLHLE